jgi:hypothetical protein
MKKSKNQPERTAGSFMKMVNSFKVFEITGADGSLFLNAFPKKSEPVVLSLILQYLKNRN